MLCGGAAFYLRSAAPPRLLRGLLMNHNSQPMPFLSRRTSRALWIGGVILATFVVGLSLWAYVARGYAWTTFLGPVGMLLLMTSYAFVRSRPKLYVVLQVIALSWLIASTVLIMREW